MSKRTLALIIVLLFITGILIAVALYPQKQSTQTIYNSKPTPTPLAQSVLSITPNPLVISSQSAVAQVAIDSGNNKVTAVQLEISFDPKKITKITLNPGDALENAVVLLNNVDMKEGRISYAIGISPTGVAKVAKGIVATMALQTILAPNEQTIINFLPKSLVAAEGVASSVLKSSVGTIIMFVSPTPIPTILLSPTQKP